MLEIMFNHVKIPVTELTGVVMELTEINSTYSYSKRNKLNLFCLTILI